MALLLVATPSGAQLARTEHVLAVERAILRLQVAEVDRLLEGPGLEALQAEFYRQHARFVRALATQDPALVDAYLTASEAYLDRLDASSTVTAATYARSLYAAEVYLARAILKGMEQRNFSAYFEVRRCYSLARALEQHAPGRADHQKLLGTFEAVAGAVPESYQWLTRLLGFGGNLSSGIRRLERAAAGSSLLAYESQVALVLARKHLMGLGERAQASLDSLLVQVPGAPLLVFLSASAQLDAKRPEQAQALLQATPPGAAVMPFIIYLRGREALGQGRWAEARGYFEQFVAQPNPRLLRRAALTRMGLVCALEGKPADARRHFEAATRAPNSLADEDAYALRLAREYLARPYGPIELALLRARLLFDGGLIEGSLAQVAQLQPTRLTPVQRIEYHYRQARAYHELGRSQEADAAYRETLPLAAPTRLWMRVYSLYYLGQLADRRGDVGSARWHYEQVLSYRSYDYRAGLETKAKAALTRLGPAPAPASTARSAR